MIALIKIMYSDGIAKSIPMMQTAILLNRQEAKQQIILMTRNPVC